MSPTASTVIALASLALAAFTVLVNYLNVRRQAEAAIQAEHVKWLRDKRDDLYGRILSALDPEKWAPPPVEQDDSRWTELHEVALLAIRYASDAVLSATEDLEKALRGESQGESDGTPRLGKVEVAARFGFLNRRIREEIAGLDEAEKTWRRYARKEGMLRIPGSRY